MLVLNMKRSSIIVAGSNTSGDGFINLIGGNNIFDLRDIKILSHYYKVVFSLHDLWMLSKPPPLVLYKNKKQAKENAKLLIKKTGCDAVKLESNKKNFVIINELVNSNIPVMGHIGYTPQFKNKFKIEGGTNQNAKKLLEEALLIQKAGAFSIVLECISPKASKLITNKINKF